MATENFEVTIAEIKKAMGAHGAWKLKLRTAITMGKSDFKSEEVSCDNLCEFGKWLYGPTLDSATRAGKPYQVIRRLHAEFHTCAAQVLSHVEGGNIDAAERLMSTEYAEISDKLGRALAKWQNELRQGQGRAA